MAKPHPWPHDTLDIATTITEHNDIFVLSLFISYYELYRKDNPGMLRGLMPSLQERIRIIYKAALPLVPKVEKINSKKLPLWAEQVNTIRELYPAILLELKQIEGPLDKQRFIEIKPILLDIFDATARIQIELIKIATVPQKKRYILQLYKLNTITEEIKHQ